MFTFIPLAQQPLIDVANDAKLGGNINGPSLIKVPSWIDNPLGRYYLYFAHHEGKSIRLAYADQLRGPWHIHWPAPLTLPESGFSTTPPLVGDLHAEAIKQIENGVDGVYPHIASPDVIIDEANREFRLYFHGRLSDGRQRSRVAVSGDGLSWATHSPILGYPYFRVFQHADVWYSLTMPGFFCRSADGFQPFDPADIVFCWEMRHSALLKRGDKLHVFWSRVGDAPERILLSTVDLSGNWRDWRPDRVADAIDIHLPSEEWEGGRLPSKASARGGIMHPVNQLRDPAIYEENGEIYLLYSVRGEQGIGIGRLTG